MIDCRVVRLALGDALPKLKHDVLGQLTLLVRLWIAVFALLAVVGFAMSFATWMYARPYKTWYDARTDRWFLFKWSLRAHRACIEKYGFRTKDEEWKHPGSCNRPSLLLEVHRVNVVNSFMLVLQAALVIIMDSVHSNTNVSSTLRWAAVCCLISPLFNLPASLDAFQSVPARAAVRFLGIAVSAVAAALCYVAVNTVVRDSRSCYEKLLALQNSNRTSYPFGDECNIDDVLRGLESSVYSSVIGVVCVISTLSGLILLATVRTSQASGSQILQVQSASAKRTAARRVFLVLVLCGVATGAIIVGLTFLFADPVSTRVATTAGQAFVLPRTGCNGYAGLCSKRIDQQTFLASHNGFSAVDASFVSPNHFFGWESQLRAGVRAFLMDVFHASSPLSPTPVPSFCHMSCGLGSYPLSKGFRVLTDFLITNTSDVVMIVLEQYIESEVVWKALDAANLSELVWLPASNPSVNASFVWPTLQELIDSKRRLLIFTEIRSSTNVLNNGAQGRTLPAFFDFAFETSFTTSSLSHFSCNVSGQRGAGPTAAVESRKLAAMNHFLTSPLAEPSLASEVNAEEVLTSRWLECRKAWGRVPTIVSVDFWSLKDPLATMAALNLKYVLS